MKKDYITIMVTAPTKKEGCAIAGSLLEKRLIACSGIIKHLESRFRWKSKIETANEVLILMKTKRDRYAAVEKEIKRLHSYEVPEIVAFPMINASKEYLAWIDDCLR